MENVLLPKRASNTTHNVRNGGGKVGEEKLGKTFKVKRSPTTCQGWFFRKQTLRWRFVLRWVTGESSQEHVKEQGQQDWLEGEVEQ